MGSAAVLSRRWDQSLRLYGAAQVDYDRNAAKRTNVIDDQSDFFEIDSNAWLSDEVCHTPLLILPSADSLHILCTPETVLPACQCTLV